MTERMKPEEFERLWDARHHINTCIKDFYALLVELHRVRKSEVRKMNLMQEAMDNCPTCRGEMDNDRRCAMCKTFLAELKGEAEEPQAPSMAEECKT